MLEAYSILKNGNLKLSEHFKVREFFAGTGLTRYSSTRSWLRSWKRSEPNLTSL